MNQNEPDEACWIETIRSHRTAKENTFASETDTPLSERAYSAFDGLEFYPISQEYHLTGRLELFSEPRDVSLDATRGPPMPFEHVGQIGMELEGDLSVLAVYRAPGVETLLLPFRDGTNGETTWTHGRYLNISAPDEERDSEQTTGTIPVETTVDFNLAYHPLCVYDEAVRSALPPTENNIPVAIRAGEKL